MAAKQYDLESSVLDWYRDFCPENSFDVQIRPDITFADVVVGMANGIDLSDLIGSDSEVFSNIVFVKLAEITGESYRTVANVWYEAPMNSDWVDEEERRLIDAAKRVVESKFEPISIGDINSPKAFDIANHAMLNEIMPSCSPIDVCYADGSFTGQMQRFLPPAVLRRTDDFDNHCDALNAIVEKCFGRVACSLGISDQVEHARRKLATDISSGSISAAGMPKRNLGLS